ncbi:NPCBM/NEW2 domain-containing protein [Nonomuraea sp. SBT364]|uniref:NPCBM/NEW2 domain-containing protein n=1 Tax=Nonomuraea sp. SBT364 TaxID=1580530 RepID=UPI00066A3ED1|nr:NPCBM/NEW2 domain-containing protein [Nonomuraea sp. SBT364]
MPTQPRDDADPAVKAAREGRNGQILAAVITGLAGVLVAVLTYLAGKDQGASQAAETTPSPAVTVTVTATATVTETASPAPDAERTTLTDGALFLDTLTPTGSPPTTGTQRVGGQAYQHSLGFATECGGGTATTVFSLGKEYQRFRTTVGLAEAENSEEAVTFSVFADEDEDGLADSDEQVGSVASQLRRPATMDVRLSRASTLILRTEADTCFRSTAVWGDPRVS